MREVRPDELTDDLADGLLAARGLAPQQTKIRFAQSERDAMGLGISSLARHSGETLLVPDEAPPDPPTPPLPRDICSDQYVSCLQMSSN